MKWPLNNRIRLLESRQTCIQVVGSLVADERENSEHSRRFRTHAYFQLLDVGAPLAPHTNALLTRYLGAAMAMSRQHFPTKRCTARPCFGGGGLWFFCAVSGFSFVWLVFL